MLLYDARIEKKRAQYERVRQKQERRAKLLLSNGYVSNSSSSPAASFSKEMCDENGNDLSVVPNQEIFPDTCMLSSSRPSSATSGQQPGSVSSRKSKDRLSKIQEQTDRKRRKQQKVILSELLALVDGSTDKDKPQKGNFYSKYHNIDKIIEQENNDDAVISILQQEQKMEKDLKSQKKLLE